MFAVTGGAYAVFAEKDQGSIEQGKLADFVVLSADPTSEKPERIKDIQVEATFVGGKRVDTLFRKGTK
jgi:predicted amidohydrolase YtcJ